MDDSTRRRPISLKSRQRSWCCSFAVPPASPENLKTRYPKHDPVSKPGPNSATYSSPQSSKSGLNLNLVNRIDPRRILSPGRVSPIDSDPTVESMPELGPSQTQSPAADITVPRSRSGSFRAPNEGACTNSSDSGRLSASGSGDGDLYDVRLKLKGRHGGCLVLEMNSGVLCANSVVFAGLIEEFNKKNNKNVNNRNNGGLFEKKRNVCRIEVPDVENLGMFRQTIELMFEENENLTKRLLKIGVYRCIDILEVSAGIMFTKGVSSCLKYLEAVPWTEEEEEKLRGLFTRFKFDETTTRDILARLYLHDAGDSQQNLARQLVWSITTCSDANARNELKSLVKGLLCRSSVYEKDQPDLNKEDFYVVCQSCLGSLLNLFDEASGNYPKEKVTKEERSKPLIERISRQVDNINWLLEILLDRQMGEEFVDLWADQGKLLKLHENASPMIRYELSRVSANLFIAMGTRKLHCPWEARSALFQAWFGPMLSDFGWLQRCKKGLEMKTLEEAMGQTLLTLPVKQQYVLFMEWFRCFSKHGTECPNLSKSFQIWWRRSFLRGSETNTVESR
ncbi:BTB/POZ domain-containing protein At2g13690 [Pistacia vera]|uniref:BTB/POZ domain-containing protein At2g13690 n=1 Tax=Pistacia vera TaxID=55513 RepID=UPI001263975D|nr:BTB/POZ domain-containing protein At2g13690 [Pistacia vera]